MLEISDYGLAGMLYFMCPASLVMVDCSEKGRVIYGFDTDADFDFPAFNQEYMSPESLSVANVRQLFQSLGELSRLRGYAARNGGVWVRNGWVGG